MTYKLPISAIIVGYNEGALLTACFSGISFCDEILYFDLGSSDNSIELATTYGAKVIDHEKVLSCEWIHSKYAQKTKYNWVLITDPDEVIDPELSKEIMGLFENGLPDNIGAILAPWLFYFKKHRLRGTAWGGIKKRILLAHNERFSFSPQIHIGRKINNGFQYLDLEYKQMNVVHHYWMQGYIKLLEKHLRYLKNEGLARYDNGFRTSFKKIIFEPFLQFEFSYIKKKGYNDGWVGIFLSIFWAWYQTSAELRLYQYQKKPF